MRLRKEAIKELIETETLYLRDLTLIITRFREPIVERQLLPSTEVSTIFSNVTTLKNVNKQLVSDLACCGKPNESGKPPMQVGGVFQQFAAILKVYSFYCNGQIQAFATVEQCRKKYPLFEKFLEELMNDSDTRGLPLISYLIKPTQRICKYPLLLRELVKHTPLDHADYDSLREALEKIEELATAINDSAKAAENFRQIITVQSRLVDGDKIGLVIPSRKFITSEVLQFLKKEGVYVQQEWFLFNDVIIGTEKSKMPSSAARVAGRKGNLKIRRFIPLRLTKASALPPSSDYIHFGFRIDEGQSDAIFLFGPSQQVTDLWITSINEGSKSERERVKQKKDNVNRASFS